MCLTAPAASCPSAVRHSAPPPCTHPTEHGPGAAAAAGRHHQCGPRTLARQPVHLAQNPILTLTLTLTPQSTAEEQRQQLAATSADLARTRASLATATDELSTLRHRHEQLVKGGVEVAQVGQGEGWGQGVRVGVGLGSGVEGGGLGSEGWRVGVRG